MMGRPHPAWRRPMVIVAALVVVAGLGLAAWRATRTTVSAMGESAPAVPTARVTRDALTLTVYMTGELRASRQQLVLAPPVGSALRILTMADNGAVVKAGDVILSFDPADQRYALEQAQSELEEAEQTIVKRRADIGAQEASDQVALLTARFNVRRAELDAAVDKDLIPANEYQIRQVSLQEARRSLAQTEQDVQARTTVSAAGISVLEETRAKAQLAADRARQNMETLRIVAPMDGVVAIRDNRDSATVFFSGMTLPPYRVGDLVNPGRPVLDIFDVSEMEIRGTVNEQDRVNVEQGQAVVVTSDSVAGAEWSATVRAISGLGQAQRNLGPLRRFEVTVGMTGADVRLLPGTSVAMRIDGPRIEDALVVPRQAVFERDGRTRVYVRTAAGFEPRDIKVLHRGEARAAIDGLAAGTEVALVEPDARVVSSAPEAPAANGPAVTR